MFDTFSKQYMMYIKFDMCTTGASAWRRPLVFVHRNEGRSNVIINLQAKTNVIYIQYILDFIAGNIEVPYKLFLEDKGTCTVLMNRKYLWMSY